MIQRNRKKSDYATRLRILIMPTNQVRATVIVVYTITVKCIRWLLRWNCAMTATLAQMPNPNSENRDIFAQIADLWLIGSTLGSGALVVEEV
jgi:hypothetical protein